MRNIQPQKTNPYSIQFKACDKHIRELSALALKNKDKNRPCSFFHYTGLASERFGDCVLILERMEVQRVQLAGSDRKLELALKDFGESSQGSPYPENIQEIMHTQDRLTKGLKLDFESLYLFGMMLLDQWALVAKCVGGIAIQKRHPFNEVVQALEAGKGKEIQSLWDTRTEQILWLFHNFRVFRNVFVAHSVEAWQRGNSRAVNGASFTMFIPSPPGHRGDEDSLNKEIYSLLHLAPTYIREASPDYWERARPRRVLEILFDKIGTIPNREDRLKIEGLFRRCGGASPTYQTVGTRLLTFCEKGLKDLLNLLQKNTNNIDLEYAREGK